MAEIAALAIGVNHMLAARFREDTSGTEDGPFRQDYASARLDGAVDLLDDTKRLAVQAGACMEFIALIDLVIKEARAALVHAVAKTTPVESREFAA